MCHGPPSTRAATTATPIALNTTTKSQTSGSIDTINTRAVIFDVTSAGFVGDMFLAWIPAKTCPEKDQNEERKTKNKQ